MRSFTVTAGRAELPQGALSDWFVVRTQPQRERYAAENVARAGFMYYLPQLMETVRVTRGSERRREFQVKPLFPCYLFAQSLTGQWHELLRTFGVVGVIPGSGGFPATVKNGVITALQAREENGIVVLPATHVPEGFRPNQRVMVRQGSYSGFIGLVQGNSASQRVQILIDYMGRKVPFLVKAADLELAA